MILETLAAEFHQALPVPIKAVGFSPTFWANVTTGTGIIGVVLYTITVLRRIAVGVEEKLRAENRAEREECNRRINAMQRKLEAVTREFFELQVTIAASTPLRQRQEVNAGIERVRDVMDRPVEDFVDKDEQ